ncbi:MAG: hypothetical protein A2X94_04540 [Bdellovibrionales bacterium GWB1_55_8]|nr:MAG: hypothetical protein A2X94_04540 [Bdellovibrionales bacterium GWB1_55_8]
MFVRYLAPQSTFWRRTVIFILLGSPGIFFEAKVHAQAGGAADGNVSVVWGAQGAPYQLYTFDFNALSKELKTGSSKEEDPATGKVVRWSGVLLQGVIDRSLRDVAIESKARVDLIILKSRSGKEAVIPRSLVTKFPVLLATSREGTSLKGLHSVIPWTSKSKVRVEKLPIGSFFLEDVVQIELANFQGRFQPFFLKRRTDPSALRGENLFLRNCVACHTDAGRSILSDLASESKSRSLASGHPTIRGFTPLSERDQRAIQSYFYSFRAENAQQGREGQVAKQ